MYYEWVIRRQLELLTYAGVDFIAFDLSNGVVYAKVLRKVMKLVQEYREQGFDCPQVTFFTHTYSMRVVNELYDSIFKKNYMPLSWWRPYEDGKPYMIAYTDPAKEKRLVASRTMIRSRTGRSFKAFSILLIRSGRMKRFSRMRFRGLIGCFRRISITR